MTGLAEAMELGDSSSSDKRRGGQALDAALYARSDHAYKALVVYLSIVVSFSILIMSGTLISTAAHFNSQLIALLRSSILLLASC